MKNKEKSMWFLTCYATVGDYENELINMVRTFRHHHPNTPVITGVFPQKEMDWQESSNFKIQWMVKVRETWGHLGDMLWVDADVRFRKPIVTPSGIDVGARAYGGSRISTGTMWVASGSSGDFLLKEWLKRSKASLSNEITLGNLLQENPDIRFKDLGNDLTSVCNLDHLTPWSGHLEHDSAIVHWNRSRHVIGGQEEWPPNEDIRQSAQAGS